MFGFGFLRFGCLVILDDWLFGFGFLKGFGAFVGATFKLINNVKVTVTSAICNWVNNLFLGYGNYLAKSKSLQKGAVILLSIFHRYKYLPHRQIGLSGR